jgi:hypothetical protein
MRKMDKKIDNQLRLALTEVCDQALKAFAGFQWLTHLVDYTNFPNTLRVVCVFDSNENLATFMATKNNHELSDLIQTKLFGMDVTLKNMSNHITYDTEENCEQSHKGKWADRLS